MGQAPHDNAERYVLLRGLYLQQSCGVDAERVQQTEVRKSLSTQYQSNSLNISASPNH